MTENYDFDAPLDGVQLTEEPKSKKPPMHYIGVGLVVLTLLVVVAVLIPGSPLRKTAGQLPGFAWLTSNDTTQSANTNKGLGSDTTNPGTVDANGQSSSSNNGNKNGQNAPKVSDPSNDVPADQVKNTVLPAGVEPRTWVKEFCSYMLSADYTKAYPYLPAPDRREKTESQFANKYLVDQVVYSESHEVSKSNTAVVIESSQKTKSGQAATYTWKFVKSGSSWIADSRSVAEMQGQL